MNLKEFSASKYLGKGDVPQPLVLTIASFGIEKFDDSGQKPFINWMEPIKPMLLNKVNRNRLMAITGQSESAHMIGMKVEVFNDPMIEMQGELVGGLRLRPVTYAVPVPQHAQFNVGSTAIQPATPPAPTGLELAQLRAAQALQAKQAGPAGADPFDQEVPF